MSGVRPALRLASRIDHGLSRRFGPMRVLVDVRTPMNLGVLRPIWRRLVDDARLEVEFAAEPGTGVREALDAEGRARHLVERDAVGWRRYDLALTADIWNRARLRRCRRHVNFVHGVAGKYSLDDPQSLRHAGLSGFDRVAFANADRLERYVAAGVISRTQAALVGFPKADDLVNGRWPREDTRTALGLSPALPTILYAPTFSAANSLHVAGEALIDALLATGGNVIVKLHDRSMRPHPRYTDGVDWPARLSAFTEHPRFLFARTADATPLLAAADLLVTDHSTVGFEFALLDRPVIVFDAPALLTTARIDPGKWDLLRSMAEVVHDVAALPAAVAGALSNGGARSAQRRAAAAALFAFPGTATERALEVVYQLLEIEPAPWLRNEATCDVFDRNCHLQPSR